MNNFDFDFLDKKGLNIKLLFVIFLIFAMAFYVGFLIYGNRGYNKLLDLQDTKQTIQNGIEKLKKENVKLQKEYFGLKDIEDSK